MELKQPDTSCQITTDLHRLKIQVGVDQRKHMQGVI